MANKNKTWETKTRIYTVYKGKRTYVIKPKEKRLYANHKADKSITLDTLGGHPEKELHWKTKQKLSNVEATGMAKTLTTEVPAPPGYEELVEANKRLTERNREFFHQTQDIPYQWPSTEEVSTLIYEVEKRGACALDSTKKEGTRQDLELALHHLRIARRYFNKALAH